LRSCQAYKKVSEMYEDYEGHEGGMGTVPFPLLIVIGLIKYIADYVERKKQEKKDSVPWVNRSAR